MNVPRSVFLALLPFFIACNGGRDQENQNALREYRTGEQDLSAIIRNPVSATGVDTVNVAKITFEEEVFDFGSAAEGDIVTHNYQFTNSGKVPLIISDARSTCGCTVPEWPKGAIAPGESGQVRVKFNTTNRPGTQRKPVTITANTYPGTTKIWLQGIVQPNSGE